MIRRILLLFSLLLTAPLWAREDYEATPGLIKPSGMILFFNAQGPLSYAALTPRQRPATAVDIGPVFSRQCQYGLAAPVFSVAANGRFNISGAMGNGGYDKALKQIAKDHPELWGIDDVKVDLQRVSILGIFSKLCTEIEARGFR